MTKRYYLTIAYTALPMAALIASSKLGPVLGFILGIISVFGYILAGFWLGRRHDEPI